MRQMNYRVDVAEDGLTAVEKLETSEYAVMITDTVLKGMDGEKLIAHCNKNYPTTICIVYATKLSVGQLGFLSNQLDVFRIFLRPVDVSGKLQQALQEAMELHYYKTSARKEEEERERCLKEEIDRIENLKQSMVRMDESDKMIMDFVRTELATTGKFLKDMKPEEIQTLLLFEETIVDEYLHSTRTPCETLKNMQEKLAQRFDRIFFQMKQEEQKLNAELIRKMYVIIWMIAYRYEVLASGSEVRVQIERKQENAFRITVDVENQPDTLDLHDNRQISKAFTIVMQKTAERMAQSARFERIGNIVRHEIVLEE